jgi:8-oxo-dGTP pyrophosphatase MutT (NUDIX family)
MSDDKMKWKVLSSEYLFKDDWLRARRETCQRPDGKIIDPYYILDYANWVCGVALTEDNQVVLIKQYRHAIGEVCIEVPGGCVDKTDKDFEEAVRREMKEETGYEFKEAEYLGLTSPNPAANSNMMHLFLLKGGVKKHEQSLDHNEDIEVLLVPLDDLFQMVLERKIHAAMHITGIMLALQKLGKLEVK